MLPTDFYYHDLLPGWALVRVATSCETGKGCCALCMSTGLVRATVILAGTLGRFRVYERDDIVTLAISCSWLNSRIVIDHTIQGLTRRT